MIVCETPRRRESPHTKQTNTMGDAQSHDLPHSTAQPMKADHRLRLALGILSWTLALPFVARAQVQAPTMPVGSLSAFPTIVQAGTHPTLTWNVTIPAAVLDIVTITPPGTVTAKTQQYMDVRILGASVKAVTTNQWGQITNWSWVPTECLFSFNGGSYTRIFYNTHDKVNPNIVVATRQVTTGNTMNFGGRYYYNNSWSSTRTSTNSSNTVIALKHGDIPPTTTPLYQQPTLESFLVPYLDNTGRLKLGPRDVIYLMELTHTNTADGGFDLQDLVILCTFRDIPSSGSAGEWLNLTTIANGGTTTTASFSAARTVLKAQSTKDLSNVILQFADGTTQKFDGLKGKTGNFQGTGSNSGKVVVGAWIKSGNNFSQVSGAPSGAGTWHTNY